MTRILISYRREDTGGWAGRLHDQLADRFEPDNVFLDLDTIEPGVDFTRRIQTAVEAADVVLVLIGPHWLSATDEAGRPRLGDPDDWVRGEIRMALERGVWTIPILVNDGAMPSAEELPPDIAPLARRNAFVIGPRFRQDVELLIESIERGVVPAPGGDHRPAARAPAGQGGASRAGAIVGSLVLVVLLIGLGFGIWAVVDNGPPGDDIGTASLSPAEGPYEQAIGILGTDWPANQEIEISAGGLARTRVRADADGAFETTIHLDPDFKPVAPETVEIWVGPVDGARRISMLYRITD